MTTPADDYHALYEKGIASARTGQYDDARRWLRAAAALDPGRKGAWLALARLEKSPEQKRAIYARVLKIDPQDAVARAYLAGLRDAAHSAAEGTAQHGVGQSGGRFNVRWLWLGGILLLSAIAAGVLLLSGRTPEQQQPPTLAQNLAAQPDDPRAETTASVNAPPVDASSTATPSPTVTGTAHDETPVASTTPFVRGLASPTPPAAQTDVNIVTLTPSAANPQFASASQTPDAPIQPPPVNPLLATNTPPRLITAAPAGTVTAAPLFATLDPQGDSTALPQFITPTEPYSDDLSTATAPPEVAPEIDPNAGGGRP